MGCIHWLAFRFDLKDARGVVQRDRLASMDAPRLHKDTKSIPLLLRSAARASELFKVLHSDVDEAELWTGDVDYKAHQQAQLHKIHDAELKKRLEKRIGRRIASKSGSHGGLKLVSSFICRYCGHPA